MPDLDLSLVPCACGRPDCSADPIPERCPLYRIDDFGDEFERQHADDTTAGPLTADLPAARLLTLAEIRLRVYAGLARDAVTVDYPRGWDYV